MKIFIFVICLSITFSAMACIVEPTEVDLAKIKSKAIVITSRAIVIKVKDAGIWEENKSLSIQKVANSKNELFIDNQDHDINTDIIFKDGDSTKTIRFEIKASARARGANGLETLQAVDIPKSAEVDFGCGGPYSVKYD